MVPTLLDLAGAFQKGRAARSVSPTTEKKYEHTLAEFDQAGKPAVDSVVADHLTGLHASGKSPETCRRVVSAFNYRAGRQGIPSPIGPATRRVLAEIRSTERPEVRSAPIWIFSSVSEPLTDPQVAGYLAGLRAAGHAPAESARTLAGLELHARQQDVRLDAGPLTRRALVGTGAARPQLSARIWKLVEASVSASTRRAYRAALAKFNEAVAGIPATDLVIASYLAGLFAGGKSPATCDQVTAALRFRAKLLGAPSPTGRLTGLMLAGIRRTGRGRGRGQVQGVTFRQALDVAAATAEDESLQGLRDAALIAVMSDGLMRVSEVAAIQVDDIAYEPDGTGVVTIRSSKTDQEGRGSVQYLGAPTVDRIKAWREKAGIQDGAVFRRLHRGGTGTIGKALSTVSIRNIIKKRCAAAGIEGYISGHSLRVGGAQSLAAGGASLVEMQTAGRWDSPAMPGHYARGQLAAKGAVARIKYGAG